MRQQGLLLLLFLFPLSINAAIYKCVDSNGHPMFSQKPCGDNAKNYEYKKQNVTGDGLRESEKVYIKEIRQREEQRKTQLKQQQSKNQNNEKGCRGITFIGFTSYDHNYFLKNAPLSVSGEVYKNRCAQVTFKPHGYHGRLIKGRLGKEIAGRFRAKLNNGDVIIGQNLYFDTKKHRVERHDTYIGNLCFGITDFEIEGIYCQR